MTSSAVENPAFAEMTGVDRGDLSGSRFRRSATTLGSGFRTSIQVHRQYRIAMHATQAQATCLALTADKADHIFDIDVKQPLPTFGTFAMVDHLRLPVGRIT
jgi:hypothetical protein